MRPFETIARATTSEGKELTLHHHDGDFYIHLNGEELMSTRRHGSEAALAEVACAEMPGGAPRILIGGLGLGYTLRAALGVLDRSAEVVVAELFEPVAEWNRTHLQALYPQPSQSLADPRVTLRLEDVRSVIEDRQDAQYHAILLDVDNGPSAWCLGSNAALYERRALEQIHRRLVPGGILAVWSAFSDERFVRRLAACGFEARAQSARARGRKGQRHTIFIGKTRPKGKSRSSRSK